MSRGKGDTTEPAVTGLVMDRSTKTVEAAWIEYEVGLGGNPPVQVMDTIHGTKWTQAASERKWYSKRQVLLYDASTS